MQLKGRLYRVDKEWTLSVNETDDRLFCHQIAEDEDFHHRIAINEFYVSRDTDVFCLACALKKGFITTTRPSLDP